MTDIPLFILYGSATGNAEQIAKDLASKHEKSLPSPFTKIICCEANNYKKKCCSIWETKPEKANKYGLIFVVSTTGNGDAPENGSRFVRYLKRKTTPDSQPFQHVAFAVLGLGDSNYDQFCESGKVVDKKLVECGGVRVKPLAMADEATGLEEVVEEFVEGIVTEMATACEIKTSGNDKNESIVNPISDEKKIEPVVEKVKPKEIAPSTVGVGSRPNLSNIPAFSRLNHPQRSIPNIPVGSRPNIPKPITIPKVAASVKETGQSISKLKSETPLCILYGSATGNAEHIAKDITEKYKKMLSESKDECYFPDVICCELDQYKKKCQSFWENDELNTEVGQKHGVIIVTSTTGNGDAPENASRFVRYIKRKTTVASMPFRNVAYAILGLGDTNYDQFCQTGKLIDKKLKELGGTRVKDIACADEGTGLEAVVEPWVDSILAIISKFCSGSSNKTVASENNIEQKKQENSSGNEHQTVSVSQNVSTKESINSTNEEKETVESENTTSDMFEMLGVTVLKRLLVGSNNVAQDVSIPSVDPSLLPPIGSCLSSCKLVDEEDMDRRSSRGLSLSEMERMTVSSTSSNINYTMKDPFESTILDARYLTETPLDGASLANEALSLSTSNKTEDEHLTLAMKRLSDSFPLNSDDERERNGKRVIEMTLSLPDDFTLEYQPGDSIGIIAPGNTPEVVEFVLSFLENIHKISRTQKIKIDTNQLTTVEEVIRYHIDLCSPIKNKRILVSLAQFASVKDEEKALQFLASKAPQGQELFRSFVEEQRISVVDILKLFPSCQSISLDGLLAILPSIPPRYYSICSSPLKKGGNLSLTVAFSVVDYATSTLKIDKNNCQNRRIGGLVTRYLETICSPFLSKVNEDISSFVIPKVKIFPKPTADFRLPSNLSTPIILIGPGTGIAPFIGFLEHRRAELEAKDLTTNDNLVSEGTWRGGFDIEEEELNITKSEANDFGTGSSSDKGGIGEIDVYFGCRYSDHDWLYKEEMKSLKSTGVISDLNVAFSRETKNVRCYVQDKIKENEKRIALKLVQESARVYICGDGNSMAKDVQSALAAALDSYAFGKKEITMKGKEYIEKMKEENRLLLDIWS